MTDLIDKLAREEVKGLSPYVCARDLCKDAEVFLDANENAYGQGELNRYPDSDQLELRRAIADYVGNGVDWQNVLAGNGSDEIIDLAMRVFVGKGDNIVCTYPDYSMYKVVASIIGAKVREVPLDENFQIDVEAITRSCGPRTKMVFFSSPNSPTGKEQPIAEIEGLARKAKAIVFVDEAYAEFSGKTAAALVKKLPNLIISRTFSKAWGMAGVRVGYMISSEKIIELARKVKPPYNVSRVATDIAMRALTKGRERMRTNVRRLLSERKLLEKNLGELGFKIFTSSTNFLLCRCPAWQEASALQRELAARGIVLRDFSQKPRLENCLRITVGTPAENRRLLSELRKVKPDFDAVFFDVDDTLIDVSRSYLEAIRLTAENISGKKVSRKAVGEVKALPTMNNDWDATVEVLRRLGVEASRREVIPIFQKLYLGSKQDGLIRTEKPLLDAKLLERVKKKIVLVTGRTREEAATAMKMLGLPKKTMLVAMEDAVREKPDPAPLLLAMEISGSKRPIYVGDSAGDKQAAANAKMAFVAIGPGKQRAGELARFKNVNEAIRRLFV